MTTSPASSKLLYGVANKLLAGSEEFSSCKLPALVLVEPDEASLECRAKSSNENTFYTPCAAAKAQAEKYVETRGKADIASILS